MKKIIMILVMFLSCSAFAETDCNAIDKENKQLRDIIATLQKEIADLKYKNKYLENQLNPKDEVTNNVSEPNSDDKNPDFKRTDYYIEYKGKNRNNLWLTRVYNKYKDAIISIDGKYVCIYDLTDDSGTVDKMGCRVFNGYWRVLQNLGNGDYLITAGSTLCHLQGYSEKGITDDEHFNKAVLTKINGIYNYTNTSGAKSTVKSFLYQEPHFVENKTEFLEAIRQGVSLKSLEAKDGKEVIVALP